MNDIQEQWRPVRGFETHYSVSNIGRVRRDAGGMRGAVPGRILSASCGKPGYPIVNLKVNNIRYTFNVHVLVLEAFGPPRPTPKHEVNHKDGNRANNVIDNLEWVTHQQNHQHKFDVLGRVAVRGEKNGQSRLKTEQILEIRRLYDSGKARVVELAAQFGIPSSHASNIVHRKTWKWLT